MDALLRAAWVHGVTGGDQRKRQGLPPGPQGPRVPCLGGGPGGCDLCGHRPSSRPTGCAFANTPRAGPRSGHNPPLVGEPLGIRLRVVNRGSNEIEGDFYPRYALDHVRIAISKDRAEAIPYVSMAMKLAAAKKIGAEPVTIAASGFVERKETIAFDVARDTSAFSAARGLSNARFPLL